MVGRSMAIRSTAGRVEAGGEHAHRGQRPDLAALEGGDDAVALGRRACRRRWSRRRRRGCGSLRATWRAWSTPAQNSSQERAVLRRRRRPRRSRPVVIGSRSTAACSWPAMNSPPRLPTPATSSWRPVCLADQRREVALVDQLADRDLVGDVGEQRVVALRAACRCRADRASRSSR